MLVARLKGVTDRNAAEALKNIRLYVAREKLPPAADDEVLPRRSRRPCGSDAERRSARHGEKRCINFGAGDLLEIEPVARRSATMMLPFTEATVPAIDLAGRKLVSRLRRMFERCGARRY
jgi:16S rRNA processing protein RimM